MKREYFEVKFLKWWHIFSPSRWKAKLKTEKYLQEKFPTHEDFRQWLFEHPHLPNSREISDLYNS